MVYERRSMIATRYLEDLCGHIKISGVCIIVLIICMYVCSSELPGVMLINHKGTRSNLSVRL